ncbi:MAG: hypothetical protein FWC71_07625 [Defluviitaleaceae bacterium]|nr:hypothetical protein [Defluviitaleaceae bacterium]
MKSYSMKSAKRLLITLILLLFISACGRNTDTYDDDNDYIEYEEQDATKNNHEPANNENDDNNIKQEPTAVHRAAPVLNTYVQYALEIANARRLQIESLYYGDLRRYTYGRAAIEANTSQEIFERFEQFAWEWAPQFQYTREPSYTLTQQQALHDLRVLRLLMQQYYGAYIFYGGDDVFLPLFNEMELNVILHPAHYTNNALHFAGLIIHYLSHVIVDNHFFVHEWILGGWGHNYGWGTAAAYFITDMQFGRSEDGFFFEENGLYIQDIHGHDMDTLFRLSINQNGDLFYTPVVYLLDHVDIYYYPLFITDAQGDVQEIVLRRMAWPYLLGGYNDVTRDLITTQSQGDIPIVRILRMGYYYESDFQRLLEYAYDLRYEPIVIIDIRSNQGGSSELATRFMRALTGEPVSTHLMMLQYNTVF